LGAVPWQVTLAAFYNFRPQSVQSVTGAWDAAAPEQWQAARFVVAERALRRVGVNLTADQIAEARSLIDPVVAGADYASKNPGCRERVGCAPGRSARRAVAAGHGGS